MNEWEATKARALESGALRRQARKEWEARQNAKFTLNDSWDQIKAAAKPVVKTYIPKGGFSPYKGYIDRPHGAWAKYYGNMGWQAYKCVSEMFPEPMADVHITERLVIIALGIADRYTLALADVTISPLVDAPVLTLSNITRYYQADSWFPAYAEALAADMGVTLLLTRIEGAKYAAHAVGRDHLVKIFAFVVRYVLYAVRATKNRRWAAEMTEFHRKNSQKLGRFGSERHRRGRRLALAHREIQAQIAFYFEPDTGKRGRFTWVKPTDRLNHGLIAR